MSLEATPVLEATSDFTPVPKLAVQSFGLSDQGLVRTSNEDQFLVASLIKGAANQANQLAGGQEPTQYRPKPSLHCGRRNGGRSCRRNGQCHGA